MANHNDLKSRLESIADPIAFLVNLFAHAPVGFAVWKRDGFTLLTNETFLAIFGLELPAEYNVLRDVRDLTMQSLFRRAFAGETLSVPTFWFDRGASAIRAERADGCVAVSMTLFPLRRADGEIEFVAATYKDDTESLVSHQALRLHAERERLAQQVAHVGSFELDLNSGVNIWSPELEALYGLKPGAFGGTQPHWEALVHPDDRAAAVDQVNEAFVTLRTTEGEWRAVWPDGSTHWLLGRFQVVTDPAGRPSKLLGVNVDVTALRAATDEIRRLNQNLERLVEERTVELRAANRDLEAFSYSVAHDLRAPVRAMHGYSALLTEDFSHSLPPEARDAVSKIKKNAKVMDELIAALLSLARITKSTLSPKRTDLSLLAREVTEHLVTADPERAVRVVIHDGLWANIDPAFARMLLENLLGNAWKFTSKTKDARIEFARAARAEQPTFALSDNGAGFDMAYSNQLFVPFQRMHAVREFPGTGVGLSTCSRIVERHGGRLWAEAQVDKGATFYFTLPNEDPVATRESEPAPPSATTSASTAPND